MISFLGSFVLFFSLWKNQWYEWFKINQDECKSICSCATTKSRTPFTLAWPISHKWTVSTFTNSSFLLLWITRHKSQYRNIWQVSADYDIDTYTFLSFEIDNTRNRSQCINVMKSRVKNVDQFIPKEQAREANECFSEAS